MFSWFKKKTPPLPIAQPEPDKNGNPGICSSGKVTFTNDQKTWVEQFDVVELVAQAMTSLDHQIKRSDKVLEHVSTGLIIKPQLVEFQPMDDGGVRTISTVEVRLPLIECDNIFEYQHSMGASMQDSLRKGFDQWAQVDLPPLLDSVREKPSSCTMMEMKFPAENGKAARKRRAVLGPVAHLTVTSTAEAADPGAEHPPFCPCCLLTNTYEVFHAHIESNRVFAIRLFAARDENGKATADCRINGIDFEPGKTALCKYVEKWPPLGVEFRKQYVILHTVTEHASL